MSGMWKHLVGKQALCLSVVVCAVVLAWPNGARADLINATLKTDLPALLEATVDDTKLGFANAVFKQAPKNWVLQVTQGNFDQDAKNTQNDIKVVVRHLVGLHKGEGPNANSVVAHLFNVVPGAGAGPVNNGVLHGLHQDTLFLEYAALDGGGSRVSITAKHMEVPAPEPSALVLCLGGAGLLGGALARRRRRAAE